jgi:putative nucleotidyltransferase with HDIG domain
LIFAFAMLAAAFVVSAAAVLLGNSFTSGAVVEAGGISPRRFMAPREIENTVATRRLIDEAVAKVTALLKRDAGADERVSARLSSFFDEADALRSAGSPIITPWDGTDSSGSPLESGSDSSLNPLESTVSLSIYMTDPQRGRLLDMTTPEFTDFREAINVTMEKTLNDGVREESMARSLSDLKSNLDGRFGSAFDAALAYTVASAALEPNLVVDEDATAAAREKAASEVKPVLLRAGQKIVDAGEPVTDETFAILSELGYTGRSFADAAAKAAGSVGTVAAVFVAMALYIRYFNPETARGKKSAILLATLYSAGVVSALLMRSLPYGMFPAAMFTMLAAILLEARLAAAVGTALSVTAATVFGGESGAVVYFLITTAFAAVLAKYTTQRSKSLFVAICVSAAGFGSAISLGVGAAGSLTREALNNSVFAALSGLGSVVMCIGTLPVWEIIFGIVTPIRLMDYADPNHPLLRRLTIEAPGTYHHSLIVANLAETAAYDVGADAALARVGAYYHDVGKLKNPYYFVENQMGENVHDSMDPYDSADVIRRHPADGGEMAAKARLPKAIRDIIAEHHGGTLIKFFYYKASKVYPDETPDERDFRYPGPLPSSRESALVMMADTVEAAVRSKMSELDEAGIQAFIRSLIKDKLDDGQLTESGLTLKDVETAAGSFWKVFRGMRHERVAYPKADSPEANPETGSVSP